MPDLRVLQLIDHLGTGGAQEVVCELVDDLTRRGIRNDVAVLFSTESTPYAERLETTGVGYHDLGSNVDYRPAWALDPRPVLRLRRLLKRLRPDIVHVHLYIAPLHLWLATVGMRRPPVVNTLHAVKATLPGFVFPSFRLTRRMTDVFVTPDTDVTYADLEAIGVTGSHARCFPYGVNEVPPSQDVEAVARVRDSCGIPETAIVALSAARLHPQRRIASFIHAVAATRERDPALDLHLLLAGDGEQEHELRQLATDLGVFDCVHFLGRRDDLPALYAASDLYVTMSIRGYVGVGGIQAVTAGLPCIASESGSLLRPYAEMREDWPCPVSPTLGPFVDALYALATNPVLRQHMASQSATYMHAHHSLEAMTDSYESLYIELAGDSTTA